MITFDPLAKDAGDRQDEVIVGTELIAWGTRDRTNLTRGKVYVAIHGAEKGIFYNRPFVTVIDDLGDTYVCHLSRFHIKEA